VKALIALYGRRSLFDGRKAGSGKRPAAKAIEAMTAGLQKVSAQLEVSKPAPHSVNNR
jgi:hypothetical protein